MIPNLNWKRLIYYCWNGDNLGDKPLNDWLVPKLFPKIASAAGDPAAILMPIGSILGFRHQMPPELRELPWLIFGSGYQYDFLDIPAGSVVFAVRGPLTLDLLRTSCPSSAPLATAPFPMGDPAVLLPWYLPRETDSLSGTVGTIMKWDWQGKQTDSIFSTSTNGDFQGWMRRFWRFERIVTDSLHAAIIADAYGIPWKPLRWEFKWMDHFGQLGLTVQPQDFALSHRVRLEAMQYDLNNARADLIRFVQKCSSSAYEVRKTVRQDDH